MPEILPHGSVIFCDDIRNEVGNKPSFMGVYTDVIMVHADFPVVIPKLCLFLRYALDINDKAKEIWVEIKMPGEEIPPIKIDFPASEIPKASPKNVLGEDATKYVWHFAAVLSPLVLQSAGRLTVTASHDGKIIPLGSLIVGRGELTTGTRIEFPPSGEVAPSAT